MLLSSSCTRKEKAEIPKPKDFSYLKIQTVLSSEDKAYYERIHNEINQIGKHFAYREENAEKKYCPLLTKMFDEISVRPISRERERERERGRELHLLFNFCNRDEAFSKSYKPITYEEYKYISKKINNSASVYSALGNYEGNFLSDKKLPKEILDKYRNNFKFYWKKSLAVDSLDLLPLKRDESLKEEYCKKAVELKQWDHIYYLTQVHSPMQIIGCLTPESEYSLPSNCCHEAMKLAVKGWSKKNLYDPDFLNPDAEEMSNKGYEIMRRELRNAILKTTSRDLDKEP